MMMMILGGGNRVETLTALGVLIHRTALLLAVALGVGL